MPIVIPILRNLEDIERYIDLIDGLIITGGVDIFPTIWRKSTKGYRCNMYRKRQNGI